MSRVRTHTWPRRNRGRRIKKRDKLGNVPSKCLVFSLRLKTPRLSRCRFTPVQNKTKQARFMFEVAICWLFMRDKCHILRKVVPVATPLANGIFPASSTRYTCKCNYHSRRILISRKDIEPSTFKEKHNSRKDTWPF